MFGKECSDIKVWMCIQVTTFVNGLFETRSELGAFKNQLRDFLVQSKEFSAQVLNYISRWKMSTESLGVSLGLVNPWILPRQSSLSIIPHFKLCFCREFC